MSGKQRRRLNYLKATKKQRKLKWLLDKDIIKTLECLFKYGTEPFTTKGHLVITTQGIIPYLMKEKYLA